MTRSAAFAPTRGSIDSCETSAVLMLTTPADDGAASAANALDVSESMKRAMKRMRWDFRMGLISFRVSCWLLLFASVSGWVSLELLVLPNTACGFSLLRYSPPPFAGAVVQADDQRARMRKALECHGLSKTEGFQRVKKICRGVGESAADRANARCGLARGLDHDSRRSQVRS